MVLAGTVLSLPAGLRQPTHVAPYRKMSGAIFNELFFYAAFEEAEKNAPAIIFIDELDAIAPKRDKVYTHLLITQFYH